MRTEDGYVIQQCLDGKPGAFGFLVEKYKKGVYALAYSEIRNFHDAQDVTQEVFIKAFQNLHTLKRWDNFMGWLCRITLNTCKNWIRTASRRPDSEYMEDQEQSRLDHSAIESYNEDIVNESVREALDSLPEIYRQVLSLRYFGGMTVREISEFLSVPKRTIDRRISEAQAKLREEIPAMLDIVKIRHDLPASFAFNIVEIVKGIRIHPILPIKAVPLGLSLAIGIIAGFLSIGTHLNLFEATISTFINSASKPKVLDVGEYPVDVMKVSNVSVMSKGQMNGNDLGSPVPSLQNALFMAPQADDGTWTKKADMPTNRTQLSISEVNGKIYVIGGSGVAGVFSTVEEYNPATNKWSQKADMPTPRYFLATSVLNGKIYAIGGEKIDAPFSTMEEYDPVADKWTRKADLSLPRTCLSACTANGKIYAIGGIAARANWLSADVEEYDPIANKWTKKADMPTPRFTISTSVVNGKIYAIGGLPGKWPPTSAVEEYDPILDTWTKKADMITPRTYFSTVVVDEKIFAFGGTKDWPKGDAILATTIEKYDPIADKWTEKGNMQEPRMYCPASLVNGKVYVIGGLSAKNQIMTLVEEYDPNGIGENINFKGKLPTTWGDVRTASNR